MKIKPIEKVKENENGSVFQFENYKFIKRKQGIISGEGKRIPQGKIILLNGVIEVKDSKETKKVDAPAVIYFDSEEGNSIKALTDIEFLELAN